MGKRRRSKSPPDPVSDVTAWPWPTAATEAAARKAIQSTFAYAIGEEAARTTEWPWPRRTTSEADSRARAAQAEADKTRKGKRHPLTDKGIVEYFAERDTELIERVVVRSRDYPPFRERMLKALQRVRGRPASPASLLSWIRKFVSDRPAGEAVEVTVEAIAREFNYSPSHARRLFDQARKLP